MSGKTPPVDKSDHIEKLLKTIVERQAGVMDHLRRQDKTIERNQKMLTRHIETLKPYIEGADFLQKAYRYTKWAYPTIIAGVTAYFALRTFIKAHTGI